MSVESTVRTSRHCFTVRGPSAGYYECVLRSVNNGDSVPHETARVKGEVKALEMTQAFLSYALKEEDSFGVAAMKALYSRTILRS